MNKKHYSFVVALAAAIALQGYPCLADNTVEAYKLTAYAADGSMQSVVLSQEEGFYGPRLLHKERTLAINGKTFSTDGILRIRIEKTMVSAIGDINATNSKGDGIVYSIGGQAVGKKSDMGKLPKGIYIVDGKKHIVR